MDNVSTVHFKMQGKRLMASELYKHMSYHYSYFWNVLLSNWEKLIASVLSLPGVGGRGEKRSY